MKKGTFYGTRLKKAYAKFRETVPTPEIPEADDPLHRLGVAVIGEVVGDVEAQRAIDQLLATMVDWNEIRVSRPSEINDAMGNPDSKRLAPCQRLITVLQSIFDRENTLSLDRLKHLGRREARQYLEELDGAGEYAVASVVLWSLGGHGVPVDDRLLKELQAADLVHPAATRAEVQAFLERHIVAAEAKEFCLIMRSFTGEAKGASESPADETVSE